MSLELEHISLKNFRNYSSFLYVPNSPITIFFGPNAIGKSNLIEAIQMITSLSSFKKGRVRDMIQEGYTQAKISGSFIEEGRHLDISLAINDNSRSFLLNGKKKHSSDLLRVLPSVTFTPDDLHLVKGSPNNRRESIDILGEQLSKNHSTLVRDYKKVLSQKNALLKDHQQVGLLDSINEVLATCAAQVILYRAALVKRLCPVLKEIYSEIAAKKELLSLVYSPAINRKVKTDTVEDMLISNNNEWTRDSLREVLAQNLYDIKFDEWETGRCLLGPHLDSFIFLLDGKDARIFGSQGQQRSVVLAYKLSEMQLIKEIVQTTPIMLLDDVMSELDEQRRSSLISYLNCGCQAFITTTNLHYFTNNFLSSTSVVDLSQMKDERYEDG